MEPTVLSFDEWKKLYITVQPNLVADLEKYHAIDAMKEIDNAVRQEYEQYVKQQGIDK